MAAHCYLSNPQARKHATDRGQRRFLPAPARDGTGSGMTSQIVFPIPYCGVPPWPGNLWSRWNLDPILLAILTAVVVLYAIGARRMARRGARFTTLAQASFYGGWAITTAALISPLCPLSVSLFAARVGQHMILALVAAPMVAAGHPMAAARALANYPPRGSKPVPCLLAATLFAAMLWLWHAPGPYAATFANTAVYWVMHITTFGAAVWLWTGLLDSSGSRIVPVIAAGVFSSVQMGLLGALITFATRPLYAPHSLTTSSWNLSPLQDQQFGGAIMWVPGCVVFLGVAMAVLWRAISPTLHFAPAAQ
jgi:putative membrane protein